MHSYIIDSCTDVASETVAGANWEGGIQENNQIFGKSLLLIGLSKFAQTFDVRFLFVHSPFTQSA